MLFILDLAKEHAGSVHPNSTHSYCDRYYDRVLLPIKKEPISI